MQKTLDFPVRRSLRCASKPSPAKSSPGARKASEFPELTEPLKVKSTRSPLKRGNNGCRENRQKAEEDDYYLESKSQQRAKISSKLNCFQKAKMALGASLMSSLVDREIERQKIHSFLTLHLKSKKSANFYICGPPGTGKTLCVNKVLTDLKESQQFKLVTINCMNFHTSTAVFIEIASELKLKNTTKNNVVESIEKEFRKKSQPTVLLLDEIDNLRDKHQEALYTVFNWALTIPKNLIVIGIANTLDFTSRTLTRFHSLKLAPVQELCFVPYSKDQIVKIIYERLKTLDQEVFKPQALELIARKVANHSGDVRKALSLCQKAIELVEADQNKTDKEEPFKVITNGDNEGSPRKIKRVLSSWSVDTIHVMKVLNEVFSSSLTIQSNLPVQQQIILCVCLLFSKHLKVKEVDFHRCYQAFVKISQKRGVSFDIPSISDFHSMCDLLESKSMVSIRTMKDDTIKKMSLKVDENEILSHMSNKTLFSAILDDDSVVRKN